MTVGYSSGQRGQTVNLLAFAFGGSNPPPTTSRIIMDAGIAQLARASAFQAEGRGFESRFPLHTNLGAEIFDSCNRMRTRLAFSPDKADYRPLNNSLLADNNAQIAQWQSTSLVRKRSAVQSRFWAPRAGQIQRSKEAAEHKSIY